MITLSVVVRGFVHKAFNVLGGSLFASSAFVHDATWRANLLLSCIFIVGLLIQPCHLMGDYHKMRDSQRGSNGISTGWNIFYKIFIIFNRHMSQNIGYLRMALSKKANTRLLDSFILTFPFLAIPSSMNKSSREEYHKSPT